MQHQGIKCIYAPAVFLQDCWNLNMKYGFINRVRFHVVLVYWLNNCLINEIIVLFFLFKKECYMIIVVVVVFVLILRVVMEKIHWKIIYSFHVYHTNRLIRKNSLLNLSDLYKSLTDNHWLANIWIKWI